MKLTPGTFTDGSFSGSFCFDDGTEALPSHCFVNEISTGIYRPGAGEFGISILGNNVINVDATDIVFGLNALPSANNTYDIGSAASHFRTIFLNNSGGTSISWPTATVAGANTDYTLEVGGGGTAGGTGLGGTFRIQFDDIRNTGSGASGVNILEVDLGVVNTLLESVDNSGLRVKTEIGGSVGEATFYVAAGGVIASNPGVGFVLDTDLAVAIVPMNFISLVGRIHFTSIPRDVSSTVGEIGFGERIFNNATASLLDQADGAWFRFQPLDDRTSDSDSGGGLARGTWFRNPILGYRVVATNRWPYQVHIDGATLHASSPATPVEAGSLLIQGSSGGSARNYGLHLSGNTVLHRCSGDFEILSSLQLAAATNGNTTGVVAGIDMSYGAFFGVRFLNIQPRDTSAAAIPFVVVSPTATEDQASVTVCNGPGGIFASGTVSLQIDGAIASVLTSRPVAGTLPTQLLLGGDANLLTVDFSFGGTIVATLDPVGTFTNIGGRVKPITAQTTTATMGNAEYHHECNGASFDLTLPVAPVTGQRHLIKNIHATGIVTIKGTVDGTVDPTLIQYESIKVYYNGTAWYTEEF